MNTDQARTYHRATSIVFLKTNEAFGGLSNMAGGFPLSVSGFRIRTSEALYQACRFPHRPEAQRLIIEMKSPMTAKMKSKLYRHDSRPDWENVLVNIMRWCLRVKLAQNWRAFSGLLLETEDRPIVEQSRKDDFWGTKPIDEDTLVGMNVLGRLLMELRDTIKRESRESLLRVQPLAIPDFKLDGRLIEVVDIEDDKLGFSNVQAAPKLSRSSADSPPMQQLQLFNEPVINEASQPASLDANIRRVRMADPKPKPER